MLYKIILKKNKFRDICSNDGFMNVLDKVNVHGTRLF